MHLDRSRVQGHRFELDPNDLLYLQLLKNTIQNAALGPPAHPHINGVPAAETLRQATPLAALFGHIQHRVQHLQIAQTDVPPLHR
jgi:hypothetical protein